MKRLFLTSKDMVALIRVSSSNTVYQFIKTGKIPQPIQLKGKRGKQLWRISDVESWLKEKGVNININALFEGDENDARIRKIFLTSREIAEIFRVSYNGGNIQHLIHRKGLPRPIKISKKKSLWFIPDVEKYLKERGIEVDLQKVLNS